MIFLGIGSNLSSSYGDRFYNIDLSISYLDTISLKLYSSMLSMFFFIKLISSISSFGKIYEIKLCLSLFSFHCK